MQIQPSSFNKTKLTSILMGAFGVALGAFGAHALQDLLQENHSQSTWNTALLYYWIHCLAIFSLSNSINKKEKTTSNRTTLVWLISTLLFTGSLCSIALGAPKWIGIITPLGGLGFILGWLLLIPSCKLTEKT